MKLNVADDDDAPVHPAKSWRELVDILRNTGNFDVVGAVMSRDDIRRRIESGSAHAAIL